jgi:hypothetical protein
VDQRKTSHLWEVFSFIYVSDFQNFGFLTTSKSGNFTKRKIYFHPYFLSELKFFF